MFLTTVVFILVLSLLVFVHELGHFYSCKKLGVKPEEFGFGFPPRAFGFYKDNNGNWKKVIGKKEVKDAPGTVYSVNWIPLGGFVRIKGEDGEDNNDSDNFNNKPVWKRAVILSAGVTMNMVLAAILFSVGFMIGLPQGVDDIDSRAVVTERKIQIIKVLPDTPASEAGLRMADIVLAINGNKFSEDYELQEFTNNNIGNELTYLIQRGDKDLEFKITPNYIEESSQGGLKKGEVGIAIVNIGLVKYPWYIAIFKGIKTSILLLLAIIMAFFEIIKNLVTGQPAGVDVAGPVGIASMTGQFARMGFSYLLQFTALLSVNLAVINFLPFPALDGGRIIFLIIEKIKGSPVKREVEAVIHNTGFILLMVLVVIVTFMDVSRFGDKFKMFFDKIF